MCRCPRGGKRYARKALPSRNLCRVRECVFLFRFSSSYNSAKSGGYRDIQLVLKLSGCKMPPGLDVPPGFVDACQRHVAEIQLHLAATHDLKMNKEPLKDETGTIIGYESGHDRYVKYRTVLAI